MGTIQYSDGVRAIVRPNASRICFDVRIGTSFVVPAASPRRRLRRVREIP
jgi:hypothetical protein